MSKARDIADFKFENITDTGTEGTKVATGTTAQRGSTAGQIRFNSTLGLAEYYTGSAFKSIDAPPSISSVDTTLILKDSGGTTDIVLTGTGFNSGATVAAVGSAGGTINAGTVVVNSDTSITATFTNSSFDNAEEPYSVKVTNTSGLSNTLADQINVDSAPAFSTASGNVADINDIATGTHSTIAATDADGDTITYALASGDSLPAGLSLNSSTGAITGDPTNVTADTTTTFDIEAQTTNQTSTRTFNIIVRKTNDGSTTARAFTSLSNAETTISNNSLGTGVYYMQVGTGTTYGVSTQQFYFSDQGANGIWCGIPIGSSSLSTIDGQVIPNEYGNYLHTAQFKGSQYTGNWGDLPTWSTSTGEFSTTPSLGTASSNNVVANLGYLKLGTEFTFTKLYAENMKATGSGGSSADWSTPIRTQTTSGYANEWGTFISGNDARYSPDQYGLDDPELNDSPWIIVHNGSQSKYVRPTQWRQGDTGNTSGNVSNTGSVGSYSNPIACNGSSFGLCGFGGSGEAYTFNSGYFWFRA